MQLFSYKWHEINSLLKLIKKCCNFESLKYGIKWLSEINKKLYVKLSNIRKTYLIKNEQHTIIGLHTINHLRLTNLNGKLMTFEKLIQYLTDTYTNYWQISVTIQFINVGDKITSC